MILTEDEAKTKWCPEARVFKSAGAPMNRSAAANRWTDDGEAPVKCVCVGSDCMAWRTFQGIRPADQKIIEPRDGYGYCGKAGKP